MSFRSESSLLDIVRSAGATKWLIMKHDLIDPGWKATSAFQDILGRLYVSSLYRFFRINIVLVPFVIANYYEFSGLKQHKFILLQLGG